MIEPKEGIYHYKGRLIFFSNDGLGFEIAQGPFIEEEIDITELEGPVEK